MLTIQAEVSAYRSESIVAHCVFLNEIHDLRALPEEAPIWHSRTTAKDRGEWIRRNYSKVKEAYCRDHGGDRLVIRTHFVKKMFTLTHSIFYTAGPAQQRQVPGETA